MKIINNYTLIALFCLLTLASCLDSSQSIVYNGRSELVRRTTDNTLQDSSLVFGRVRSAVNNTSPQPGAKIWIEQPALETTSTDSGYYELMLPPGTYSLKCLGKNYNASEYEEFKNLILTKNEKVEINFYLRLTIE